jgi:hypothetical protein
VGETFGDGAAYLSLSVLCAGAWRRWRPVALRQGTAAEKPIE